MKRTKLMSKLMIAVLVITILTGFASTFATAKRDDNQRSIKLVLTGVQSLDGIIPATTVFIEDGVLHLIDWGLTHQLEAIIEDDEITITGNTIMMFKDAKMDLTTGDMVMNGKTWIYFTWGGLTGYFFGTVTSKIVNGVLSGTLALQGFDGFKGMKLFGVVFSDQYPPFSAIQENRVSGTILIPN